MSRPVCKDHQTALLLGLALTVAGSLLLYDAFENRGRTRPWALKLLPGA